MALQKSKNIKIARNGLKYTKTILECHIEVPQGHYIDLRHHTSQPIFPHFWAILGVKYPIWTYQ